MATKPRVLTEPRLGERSKEVFRRLRNVEMPDNERKLLLLLAAYRDAGEQSPPVIALIRRLRYPWEPWEIRQKSSREIVILLRQLIYRRMIYVDWRKGEDEKNVYYLTILGERLP